MPIPDGCPKHLGRSRPGYCIAIGYRPGLSDFRVVTGRDTIGNCLPLAIFLSAMFM